MVTVQTGYPIIGAMLFPVGFCMLYLLGFDVLTGVFVLCPLALIDKRPGVTLAGVLRNWGLVFVGNFGGAFTVALMMAVVNTFLFPSGLLMGGKYTIMDYLLWNEIPTVIGNLVGGLSFTGLTLYATHVKTAPKRDLDRAHL